ncbi:MAG: arginine--tRNA ligase [Candidatus Diapherotrites archaeon]
MGSELNELIALAIEKELNGLKTKKEIMEILAKPPSRELGDLSFPCFSLAKEMKKSPNEIAEELSKKILIKGIEKISAEGGYMNFFFDSSDLAKKVIEKILKEKNNYGKNTLKKGKKVMVEFSSPNTNKPLHLGHLRNMSLGESISRIYEAADAKVFRTQIINDRGIHICKSMLAYQKWGNGKKPSKKKKSDHLVGDFYVLFSEKSKQDTSLEIEAHQLLLEWEKGNKETLKLWKQMNKWAMDGFNETYKKFGIKFHKNYYESGIYKEGKKIILDALKKGVFSEQNGAVVVPLEKFNLPNKVAIRADGSSLYITQDIYLAQLKVTEFKLDESIYVIGSEQNLYFKQLFKTLELLSYPWEKNLYHLSYGMVNLPEGKMKSREGTVVDADDLMNEMQKLAEKEIKKRDKKISKKELEKRAKEISLGAIKFFLLKNDHLKDMTFDPEQSISFEGETGPYVQYAYARAKSILRKAKKANKKIDFKALIHPKEKELIIALNEFRENVMNSLEAKSPHKIAHYLLELSAKFNSFYHEVPVLKAEEKELNARTALINAAGIVLQNGLDLLGINALEKM